MVCYMYYTDVFVGQVNNINNLNKALNSVLSDFNDSIDLTLLDALASGLGSFIGYGSGGQVNGSGIGNINGGSQKYVSSYNSSDATWEKLCKECKCKTVPNSCSSCSCGSSGVCSNPSECCDNCDVKKAAKIFLGILPCLYYALKYLYEKCKGDWKTLNISDSSKSLGRFLVGMGYDLQKLNGTKNGGQISTLLSSHIFKDSSKPLEKLYNVSKIYFTSRFTSRSHVISSPSLVPSSTSKSQPKTVREILLWLSGLPFTPGFEALLEHCKDLCKPVKDSVQFNDFEASLFNSCFLLPISVLTAIERPGTSEVFPSESFINSKFFYPEDPFDLFNMFLENVRKVYIPLNFLRYQCERITEQGGWQDCAFGQGCKEALENSLKSPPAPATSSCCQSSGPHGILCTSKPGESDVHEHCISSKSGVSCLGLTGKCEDSGDGSDPSKDAHTSGKCDTAGPCPHPLLMFLIDGSDSQSKSQDPQNFRTPFHLPGIVPMGFSPDNLISPGQSGQDLYGILIWFCTNGFYPLTRLLQFSLCISRTPPDSLGELFGFFKKFKDPSVFSSGALKNLFESYVDDEPGFYSGSDLKNALKDALETLKGSSHSSSHSGSHPYDLRSLIDCHVPQGAGEDVTCGAYLNSLTGDVYDIFIDSPGMYLSWICYLPKDFKTLLEEFKEKFSSCCLKDSSCKSIVKCPCALPLIYSQGFSFTSASSLSGQGGKEARKCSDFIAQLGKVVGPESPLQKLLDAIDKFLWHIRFPFFFGFIYVWFFVLSYFFYVHLYHLDILELNSHDHPAWSFKIPPSILFSDSSSKISGIRYFHPW
ncbi:variant erythrocyte surface antigen-1 family protein [Babesia divergens]|uniref:Variant erythrocyte surface antigen-1 family protein n=1 Tax=Babesia divergens TaxID=32595 RepID=A0AAD9GBX9_BABDI|nr:variant erythrocyte surface antigen-1 family protein [Babesia divergens]